MIVLGATILIFGVVLVASKSTKDKQPLKQNITTPTEAASKQEINEALAIQTNPDKRTGKALSKKEENSVESSKDKGDAYEDFVVNLLADWRLTLLDRTQDAVSSAGVVAESCKNPDLHIQQKRGKGSIDYYLECKYRSNWKDGKVTFDNWQLDRYRQFQRDNKRKVIFAIGIEGTPSAPSTFMLVPLDSIIGNSVKQISTQYAVQPNSSALVEYIDNYFTTVFEIAKNRKQTKK